MIATEIIHAANELGITLKAEGEAIRFRPTSAMTPDLAIRIQEHRAALLRQLQAPVSVLAASSADGPAGEVVVGKRIWRYQQWRGEPMVSNRLGFDTETTLLVEGSWPTLAIVQVFDGQRIWLVRPCDVAAFIAANGQAFYAIHNAAFDWWVIYEHLRSTHNPVAEQWLAILEEDRVGDSMLLDQLIQIAEGVSKNRPRALDVVARTVAGVEEISKKDPWRLRYEETIDRDWSTVPEEAWHYAAKDPVATRLVYGILQQKAQKLATDHGIAAETVGRFGHLAQRLQVKASVALADVERRGIGIDPVKRDRAREVLLEQHQQLWQQLSRDPAFGQVLTINSAGNLVTTPTGKPTISQKKLRAILESVASQHEITPNRTKKGLLSLASKFWNHHASAAPFIRLWLNAEQVAKQLQFFVGLASNRVHPRYQVIVDTGRTSCEKPNIQSMPRAGQFREMFIPTAGYVFLIIDYSFLELRTLAAVCEQRGPSVLADTIRAGTDPHVFTAAMLNGQTLEEYLELNSRQPEAFKQRRQAAKAINFGVPGGMRAETLAQHAQENFGVQLTLEEADQFRTKLITEVYPELGDYLQEDLANDLATSLGCQAQQVRNAFGGTPNLWATKRIVAGETVKSGGEPYKPSYLKKTWYLLRLLNKRSDLSSVFEKEVGSPELRQRLFSQNVVTLTGRVRSNIALNQRFNTPFQGLAADGAKIALWNLFRNDFRVVAFVHDEFVIELPEGADFDREAERINAICCDSMQSVTGGVPIACEYAVASCWSKRAELIRDDHGRIAVWRPGQ
jgi:DNA polymerase I-like protein with 3'-5' exonuclease and polymerase domains